MLRLGALFVAVCMVLIAGSIGAVVHLALKMDLTEAGIIALAALVVMALYNTISNRLRDRSEIGDQIADLSRGTADLARQMAELSRRTNTIETRIDHTFDRARGALDPLAAEIGELGGLVRQLADTVASHEAALQQNTASAVSRVVSKNSLAPSKNHAATGATCFHGLSHEQIVELVSRAIDAQQIDLFLQPTVTLPQRKVRYYEAVSRLRMDDGEIIPAADFIEYVESAGLMPKLDNLLLFRCVHVTRRLQMKNRDVGLFCNVSPATLTDVVYFKQMLDFMEANRALAPALTFEFSQSAFRSFGPIERESLAALIERGFRFSMDHVADLRMEPRELVENGFRFLKVPAKLLLNQATIAQTDIHPEDIADLLARSGIDLIAERIENESTVVDLLDYDVRFGQGFLFSPPRPVRAEALQAAISDGVPQAGELAGAPPA